MRQIYELSNLARRAQTEIPELVPASFPNNIDVPAGADLIF
jgi:hypothetical protein